jgi:hypothetical protein
MQMQLCIRLELFMSGSKRCEKWITNMSLTITMAYVGLSRVYYIVWISGMSYPLRIPIDAIKSQHV